MIIIGTWWVCWGCRFYFCSPSSKVCGEDIGTSSLGRWWDSEQSRLVNVSGSLLHQTSVSWRREDRTLTLTYRLILEPRSISRGIMYVVSPQASPLHFLLSYNIFGNARQLISENWCPLLLLSSHLLSPQSQKRMQRKVQKVHTDLHHKKSNRRHSHQKRSWTTEEDRN